MLRNLSLGYFRHRKDEALVMGRNADSCSRQGSAAVVPGELDLNLMEKLYGKPMQWPNMVAVKNMRQNSKDRGLQAHFQVSVGAGYR